MGRATLQKKLNVWMNGLLVGTWTVGREHILEYNPEWISHPLSRPLSLSLPLSGKQSVHKGPYVEAFFENLLPDSDIIRKRIQSRFGIPSTQTFDLLREIGRDCVGAIQLLPENEIPWDIQKIKGRPVNKTEISGILQSRLSPRSVWNEQEEFRISLAGAQEKTAFLRYKGQWLIPERSTPTSHIFKLPLGKIGTGEIDLSTSVENEWLCHRILHHFGMKTAESSIVQFENEKVLIVRRFDRRIAKNPEWIIRIPQEDFCQASGTSDTLKYESDGGPGITEIMDILRNTIHPQSDRKAFFKSQILFWLLAAPDGHAKNFSIFLHPGGRYELTPLYDVLSLYPMIGKGAQEIHPKRVKMAMAVRGDTGKIYNWNQIQRRHWLTTARICGLGERICEKILDEVISQAEEVCLQVEKELPENFPISISRKILNGIRDSVEIIKPLSRKEES